LAEQCEAASPGLKGIEKASGVDVAGVMIQFIEESRQPGKVRASAKG
jgi:ribosomal protein S6--L-glutamate ligase